MSQNNTGVAAAPSVIDITTTATSPTTAAPTPPSRRRWPQMARPWNRHVPQGPLPSHHTAAKLGSDPALRGHYRDVFVAHATRTVTPQAHRLMIGLLNTYAVGTRLADLDITGRQIIDQLDWEPGAWGCSTHAIARHLHQLRDTGWIDLAYKLEAGGGARTFYSIRFTIPTAHLEDWYLRRETGERSRRSKISATRRTNSSGPAGTSQEHASGHTIRTTTPAERRERLLAQAELIADPDVAASMREEAATIIVDTPGDPP